MSLVPKKQINPTTNKSFEQEREELAAHFKKRGEESAALISSGIGDQTNVRLEENQIEAGTRGGAVSFLAGGSQEAKQYISTSQKEQIAKETAIQKKKQDDNNRLQQLEEDELGKALRTTVGDEETIKYLDVEKELGRLSAKKNIGETIEGAKTRQMLEKIPLGIGSLIANVGETGTNTTNWVLDLFVSDEDKVGLNHKEEIEFTKLKDTKDTILRPIVAERSKTYRVNQTKAQTIVEEEKQLRDLDNQKRLAKGLAINDTPSEREKTYQAVIAKYDELLEQTDDYLTGNTDFFAGLSTTSEDFFSLGIRPIMRDMKVVDIIDKKERIYKAKQAGLNTKEETSDADDKLLEVYQLSQELASRQIHKGNWWYTTGQGVGGSMGFMAQIMITRTPSAFVKESIKKAIGAAAIKRTGLRAVLKEGAKKTTFNLLKNSLAGIGGMASQVPITPMTYKTYAQDQIGNIEIIKDDNGKERIAVRQELYDLKKDEYEGKIAIINQLIKLEKDPEKISEYENNLTGIQAEFDSYVVKSKLSSSLYAAGETTKEIFSETYAGRGFGYVAKGVGRGVGSGLRRVGLGKVTTATGKSVTWMNTPFKKANNFLNNLSLGKLSASQIGKKTSGGLIQSVPEEIFEEIFVQAVPGFGATGAQYKQQFEELGKLSFYRDVAAQTLIMGGSFGIIGTAGRTNSYFRDKKNYAKALQNLHKDIADKNLDGPLALSTGYAVSEPMGYRMAAAKLREKGNYKAADQVEQRMFINLATQAARLGDFLAFEKSIQKLQEDTKTPASYRQNAMFVAKQIDNIKKAYDEHSDKSNFDKILNATVFIGLHENNLLELEKQGSVLAEQATKEIDAYLKRTGQKMDYSADTFLTNEFADSQEQEAFDAFVLDLTSVNKENNIAVQNLVTNINMTRGLERDIAENRKILNSELSVEKQESIDRKKALSEEYDLTMQDYSANPKIDLYSTETINTATEMIGEVFKEHVTKEDITELRDLKLKQAKAIKAKRLKDVMTRASYKITEDTEKEANLYNGGVKDILQEEDEEGDSTILKRGINSSEELDVAFGLAAEIYETPEDSSEVTQIEKERKDELEKRQQQSDNLEKINPNAKFPLFNVGQKGNEGNKYTISSAVDERTDTNNEGVSVISKIIRPAEVNDDGEMIKSAIVEVTIFDSMEQAEKKLDEKYNKYKAITDKRIKKAKSEVAKFNEVTETEEIGEEESPFIFDGEPIIGKKYSISFIEQMKEVTKKVTSMYEESTGHRVTFRQIFDHYKAKGTSEKMKRNFGAIMQAWIELNSEKGDMAYPLENFMETFEQIYGIEEAFDLFDIDPTNTSEEVQTSSPTFTKEHPAIEHREGVEQAERKALISKRVIGQTESNRDITEDVTIEQTKGSKSTANTNPKVAYSSLETRETTDENNTFVKVSIPVLDVNKGNNVNITVLIDPDGVRTGDILDIEVSEEKEWSQITVSNGRDNNGKTILTTFDKWLIEKAALNKMSVAEFKNTIEFQNKLPMWYVIDGQRNSNVQEVDWYSGYNIKDPLDVNINPHAPHPAWAAEIKKGKDNTQLLRQNIKAGLREVTVNKEDTSVFHKIPKEESFITLTEANPQTIIAVQTGENISIGEKMPFTDGIIVNQSDFSDRYTEDVPEKKKKKGQLKSDAHTWEIRRWGQQQLPNGKWIPTYRAFEVQREVIEEQVETVKWALAANAVKKGYTSYTEGTTWGEMSQEQAKTIRDEVLRNTGLDIFLPKDLLSFVESFLQIRDRPIDMDGKVSYYQKQLLKNDLTIEDNPEQFAQHTKVSLLNSRSFKSAVHIIGGTVTSLNKSYTQYLKDTLKTSVKSFNIGTEEKSRYITQIQPIINITYTPIVEAPIETVAEKVIKEVIEQPIQESTFDLESQRDFASTLGIDIEDIEEGEAMISNQIESVRELLVVIAGLTSPQEQDIRDFITHTIAGLRDALSKGKEVANKRQFIETEAKLKLTKKLDTIYEALNKNLALIQKETVKTPEMLAYEKAYTKALQNIKNIEEQFSTLFERAIINYERQSKVEVEEDNEREDELEDKNYSKESVEESSKLSVGTILRNFLYGVERKNSKGVVDTGYLGLPKYYSFNEIFNELTKVLSVGSDLPSSYDALIKKLENSDIPFTKDILAKLKEADEQIQNQFLYTFVKHTLSSHFSMYQSSGQLSNLKSYETNANEAIRVIEKKWNNDNRSSGLYNRDLTIDIDKVDELIAKYESFLTEEGVSTDLHREWLTELGLTFTDAAWDQIVTEGLVNNGVNYTYNNILLDDSLGIFKPIVMFLNQAKANPSNFTHTEDKNIFKDLSNKVKSLAKVEAKYNTTLISLSYRDGDKNIYTQTGPTYFTDRVDDLLAASTQGGENLIDDLQSLSFSGNSIILDFLKNVPVFREMFKVSHAAIVTLKERGEDAGSKAGITDLGEIDFDLNINTHFGDRKLKQLPGTEKIMGIPVRLMRMLTPTMSDKSKAYYLDTVGLDLLNSEDLTTTDTGSTVMSSNLKDLLVEQLIMPEVNRIINFYSKNPNGTNVKGYDMGAAIFHLIPALNTLRDSNKVSILQEMRSVPNLTADLVRQKFLPQFRSIVENVVIAEADAKRELWKEQYVVGVGSKMISTNYFTEIKKSPVLDYDKAIYDVVINGILHNSEMFKVFAGDMAMYSQDKVYKIETKNSTKKKKEVKSISEFTTEDWVGINKAIGVNLGKRLALLAAPGSKIAGSADPKFRFYNQIFLKDSAEMAPNMEYLIPLHYGKDALTPVVKNILDEYTTNLEIVDNYKKGAVVDMISVDKANKRMAEIKEALRNSFPAIADFLELESTDAQEYTTAREHINIIYRQGRLTPTKFKEINEKLDQGKDLTREDLKLVLQPIKPVHTGMYINKTFDTSRTVYIKSSSYPLLPQFTRGTKLNELREKMEQLEAPKSVTNPIGTGRFTRASFQSANKVGATQKTIDPLDKYSLEGIREYAEGDVNATVLTLDRNNFRIQQDVPIKSEKKKDDHISMGTQFFKLLFGDGITKDEFSNDITGYEIDGQPMTGRQLYSYYNSAFSDMAKLKRTELFQELGLNSNGNIVDKGQFILNLKTLLKKEATSRGYSLKSIAGLEIDQLAMMGGFFYEFKTPLWLSPDKNRYEALLNSIVSNRLMKFKIPGNSYVAGSESGTEMREGIDSLKDIDERTKSRIIYLDNYNGKELGGTLIEDVDGTPIFKKAQVFVRSYFKDPYTKEIINLFEGYNSETGDTTNAKYLIRRENGTLGLKEGMIDPKLFNMFSFRTPTSSHVSGSSIEIAGILPPEMGELMIVPKNFTKQKGLDFDVDKENVYQLNHILDQEGNIKELTKEYADKIIGDLKRKIDEFNLQNISASIKSNFANELFKAFIQGKGGLLDEESLETLLAPQLSIAEKFLKIETLLNSKVAENKFIKAHLAVFNNPNPVVQKKINKSLSMAFSQEQANLLEKIGEQSDKEKGVGVFVDMGMSPIEAEKKYMESQSYKTVLSFSYQKMKMDLGAIGKVAIGVYANYTTMNGLIQQQEHDITLDMPIQLGNLTSNGSLGMINSLVPSGITLEQWKLMGGFRSTAEIFAEKENTATDNEKEQVLGRVGVNDQTINVDALLTLLGFDADMVLLKGEKKKVPMSMPYLLLSQPSIKEYNKKLKNSDGVLGGFLNRDNLKKQMAEQLSGGKITYGYDPTMSLHDKKNKQTFRDVKGNPVISGKLLTGQNLYEGIASKGTDKPMVQLEALISYLELEKQARTVSKAQSVINTNNLGKSLLESSKVYESLGKLPDMGIANIEKLLGTFSEMPSNEAYKIDKYYVIPNTPQGQVAIHGLHVGNTLFKDFFPYQDVNIENVVKEILTAQGLKVDEMPNSAYIKEFHSIMEEIIKYINSNPNNNTFSGDTREKRLETFVESDTNTSLSTYLRDIALQKTNKKGVNSVIKNALFKRFSYTTGMEGELSLIKYNNAATDNLDEEILYNAMLELALDDVDLPPRNGKPYTTRLLVEDLIAYSFLEGGVQSATQFSKFIPIELLEFTGQLQTNINDKVMFVPINKKLQMYNNRAGSNTFFANVLGMQENDVASFTQQYFQNNPKKVKRIYKGAKFKEDGGLTYNNPKGKVNPIYVNFTSKKGKEIVNNVFKLVKGDQYRRIDIVGQSGIKEYTYKQQELTSLFNKENTVEVSTVISTQTTLMESILISPVTTPEVLLDQIQKLTFSPEKQYLAEASKWLLPLLKEGKVMIKLSDKLKSGIDATTSRPDNKGNIVILLSKEQMQKFSREKGAEVVLHEILHSVAVSHLTEYFDNTGTMLKSETFIPSHVEKLMQAYQAARTSVQGEVTALEEKIAHNKIAGNPFIEYTDREIDVIYGLTNIFEFVSVSMTSEVFQTEFGKTPFMNSNKSIMDKIKEFFINMVTEIYPALKDNTIAKESILATMQFIQEERGAIGTTKQKQTQLPSTNTGLTYGKTVEIKSENPFGKMTAEQIEEQRLRSLYGDNENKEDAMISNNVNEIITTFGQSIESLGISQEEWGFLSIAEQDKIKKCN